MIYQSVLGVPGVTLPDDPIQAEPDFASAKAAFESLRPVRILFDNGAANAPGAPGPGFEKSFSSFPAPKTSARSWYLGRGGKLRDKAGGNGADQFTWDDEARPPTDFTGNTGSGDLWTAHPSYDWSQNPAGNALSYVTSPLASDTAVLGAGELQVWVRSQARNVDLQATISEVRPDDKETFVQGGWLRTDARKMDRKLTSLTEPVPSLRKADVKTLPKGRFVKVRIPLYYEGHMYREGSRIRITLSAPGGDQPIWGFAETPTRQHPLGRRGAFPQAALAPGPSGHEGDPGVDRVAALSRVARRALPGLRRLRQREVHEALSRADLVRPAPGAKFPLSLSR